MKPYENLTLNDLIYYTSNGTKFEVYTPNNLDKNYRTIEFTLNVDVKYDYDDLYITHIQPRGKKDMYVECELRA